MQKRSESTRQVLVRAAAELIAEGRPSDAGLVSICRVAGVSRGALYYHFRSIAELVTEVRSQARVRIQELADRSFGGPADEGPARFSIALGQVLAEDRIVRAGLQLGADGTDATPRLRDEVLDGLRSRFLESRPDASRQDEALADLVVVLAAGLESLGHASDQWWDPSRAERVWSLVPSLHPAEGQASARE